MEHQYVTGFRVDLTTGRVLLIEKKRPAWHAGQLNGIGGSIEPGETPLQAVVREFKEETGKETSPRGMDPHHNDEPAWSRDLRLLQRGRTDRV